MFKGRLPIGRMMSASYVRIVKADEEPKKRKDDRTQVGYSALSGYVEKILNQNTEGKIDDYQLYTRMLYANNYLLGHALGMKTDDDFTDITTDEGDELPSLLHEPIYTPSVALWMKRLTGMFPSLKDIMEEDEEMNGPLDDALKRNRGIRSDISKFLSQPFDEERPMKSSEMNGIYNLLSKTNHPIAESLFHAIDRVDAGVLEKPPPRKKTTGRGRVKVTSPSYLRELEEARAEQEKRLGAEYTSDGRVKVGSPKYDATRGREAAALYDRFFEDTEGDFGVTDERRANYGEKRAVTSTTKKFIDYINRQLQAGEDKSVPEEYKAAGQKLTGRSKKLLTPAQAFDELQNRLNKYMIALTGEPAWGTAGGKKYYGGDYGTPRAPSLMTPSLYAAGKELGLNINERVNAPDEVLNGWWKGKDPTSDEVRDELADNPDIGNEEDGMHISLRNALREGGVLDTVLESDLTLPETTGMAQGGSIEERGAKAAEAGTKGATTQSSLMSREDEIAHIQAGNESRAGRIKVRRDAANLENLLNTGQISDREYQVRKLHGDSISEFDNTKIMNGLEGRDFGEGHPFFGMSAEDIAEKTSGFVDNLIGMGRLNQTIKNLVIKNTHGNETQEDRREGLQKFKELQLTSDDYLDMMDYFDSSKESPRLTEDKEEKFQLLSQYIGRGDVNEVLSQYATNMNKKMNRFKELGMSPMDLLEASLKYSGQDMTREGFNDALRYLHSKVQGGAFEGELSEFAMGNLFKYLEQQGRRAARDEEYHQKVSEQNARFDSNRSARDSQEEQKDNPDEDFDDDDSNHDIFHDEEECQGCHHSRFMTGDADTAKEDAPWDPQRKKTPYTHKMMQVPLLKKYRDEDSREIKDIFLIGQTPTDTSLSSIADYIFPDEGYSFKEMNEKQLNAKNKSKWTNYTQGMLTRKIKEAVVTGNPKAQAIFKKFNLFKTGENTIASGSAGYNNEELVASGFLLPKGDAHDEHYENARIQTLNAIRYDAMLNAMDLLKSFANGEIPDETGKGRKVSLGSLQSGNGRQALLDRIIKLPNKAKRRKTKALNKAKEELEGTKEAFDLYQKLAAQLAADEEKTKPQKVMEDGVERTYPGEYSSPIQLQILKDRREELQNKYKPMLTARKSITKRIQKHTKGLKELGNADTSSITRYDDYALGAFMSAGGYIVKLMRNMEKETKKLDSFKRWDDDARKVYYDRKMLEEMSKLMQEVYPADDDSILQGDETGRVTRDYQHSPSKYKMGRVGEMLGTGVQHFANNKALPRPNDMNQLRALRLLKGHEDLTAEEKEEIQNVLSDTAYASTMDDELLGLLGSGSSDDTINHTSTDHPHHEKEEEENKLGLLSETEARKRHHNSHFTRGAEEEIAKGNISADLISNWEDKAPTLCGTCHGHGHISRGGAASFIRNHVLGFEDKNADSPEIKKYIERNMRPRDTPSWKVHAAAEDMDADDHEQIACPSCEHKDPSVEGGLISNGLCSHCFGGGVRDPESKETYDGYVDQDGNKIEGARVHKHTKGKMSPRLDSMNQMMQLLMDYRSGKTDIPDYLAEVISNSKPVSLPHDQYRRWLETGKYTSTRDLVEQRKDKKLTEPLPKTTTLDLDFDEPPPPPPGHPIESALEEMKRLKEEREKALSELPTTDRGRYGKYGMATSNPEANVHRKLMDAHINRALEERVDALQKMAFADPNNDGEEITALVDDILQHPHRDYFHNNEDHPMHESMFKLQKMAEAAHMSGKVHSDLIFAHGRFLTPEEYHEDLFTPGGDKRPKQPSFADMVRHYRGNDEAEKLLYRLQQKDKFKQHDMDSLMDVIKDPSFTDKDTGEQRPMTRVKTKNIVSNNLNQVLRQFKMQELDPTETGTTITWSDAFKSKIADKKLSMSKVNQMLNMPNAQKQPRGLDNNHATAINKQIKPLWIEYAKHVALMHFIEGSLNKLDYPNLNDKVTIANFSQITRDDNTQAQFYDEAAMLLGFESEADMDKKVKLNQTLKLGKLELKPQDFKRDVLAAAHTVPQEDEQYGRSSVPIVGFNNGKKLKVLHVNNSEGKDDVSKHITDTRDSQFSDEEMKKYQSLENTIMYEKYPNWMHREVLEDILHGDDNEDGMDFNELQRLYREHDLPLDITEKLDKSKMHQAAAHPTLARTPTNYNDSLQFDYAQNAMFQYNQQAGTTAEQFAEQTKTAQINEEQRRIALERFKESIS